jgi:hypothetical protein
MCIRDLGRLISECQPSGPTEIEKLFKQLNIENHISSLHGLAAFVFLVLAALWRLDHQSYAFVAKKCMFLEVCQEHH